MYLLGLSIANRIEELTIYDHIWPKAWVATVFCVARTHLARPDFSSHAHVCAPSFYDGRTSHPHAHLFCSKSNLEDTFIEKKPGENMEVIKNIFV